MANDAGIIKEFLVALGFKVDDKKLKDFTGSIDRATKFVGKLAVGMETLATAATTAVVKVSEQFENLYYASQRLQDTVEDIRGFSFAMGQVGSTGKAGLQAMENVAEFLRSNPGGQGLFQAWGIQLKYVNGQAQVTSQTMDQLAAVFRKMPYYQAKQYAGMLGIDPSALQAMLRGTEEAQKRASAIFRRMGVDQDQAALASKNLMNDFRELLLVLTVGMDKIVLRVQPVFDEIVRGLEDLDRVTRGWSTGLIVLAAALLPLLTVLDPVVVLVLGLGGAIAAVGMSAFATDSDQATGALARMRDALDGLVTAAKAFAGAFPPEFWSFLWKAVQAIGGVFDDIATGALHMITNQLNIAADLVHLISDLLHGEWKAAWKDAAKVAADSVGMIKQAWRDTNRAIGDAWDPKSFTQKPGAPGAPAAANDAAPAAGGTIGFRNNNPGNLRTGPVIGPGKRAFGKYATPLAGLTAMARNLEAYSRQGLNTVSTIINRWAPRADHNDTEAYVRDVARKLGVAANEQVDLKDPATLIKMMDAITRHENKQQNPYSGALMSQAASAALGRPVAVTQTNTYHIDGSRDPQATAKAVAAEQERVHNALIRNLSVAAS